MTAHAPTPIAAGARSRVLVVDDEPDLRTLYELALSRDGHEVHTAESLEDGWLALQDDRFDLIITDMRLPDGTGLQLIQRLEQAGRPERAIVITAYGSAENAVEALKAGAYDYLTKPVELPQLRRVVQVALDATRLARGQAQAAAAPESAVAANAEPAAAGAVPTAEVTASGLPAAVSRRLVGQSAAMAEVRARVAKVARSMAPVHLRGESGSGKEVVARAIHDASARAARPFVPVNCGAIPETLLEAEFFGVRKGAFTGATEDREGYFQAASGGTLFLDEIGDLPLAMQAKLLRAIQERSVRPLGGTAELPVDVRLVSATHRDLAQEVNQGRFRQDLYYRLNVIAVPVPPLRDRLDDLPALAEALLARIGAELPPAERPRLDAGAIDRLRQHDFPGNVRELENLLHRAVAMRAQTDRIDAEDLTQALVGAVRSGPAAVPAVQLAAHGAATPPAALPALASDPEAAAARPGAAADGAAAPQPAGDAAPAPGSADASLPKDLAAHLDAVERDILERALLAHRYNRTAAGASLGLSLRQMRYRMARLGIGGEAIRRPDPAGRSAAAGVADLFDEGEAEGGCVPDGPEGR